MPIVIDYAGESLTLRVLSARTGIRRNLLWTWFDRDELSPERVAAYQRRKVLRALAKKHGLDLDTVFMRVARGEDPLRAATRPARGYERRRAG